MSDADIEQLFELARTDGVMPIVRRTASFNRHRKLILDLLKHPPVRQSSFAGSRSSPRLELRLGSQEFLILSRLFRI